ncbi:hypothetical protein ACTHQ1_06660 [Janibacter anophelis]|uniref:hypothetical protein n=1 Tax=Janibacter anophelis TaxID=319054 RepID=UPI003F7F5457
MSQPSVPQGSGSSGDGGLVWAILTMTAGLGLGVCALCVLGYGGLGAVMVDQAQDDPWVVWSIVVGLIVLLVALAIFVAGVVLMVRRRG